MPFFKHFSRKRVYLDYASSTPVDARMIRNFPKIPANILGANPSALHKEAVALRKHIEAARALCARALDVHADEIIFTSGATESDNLALVGTVYSWLQQGIQANEIAIVTSEFEHAAVLESVSRLAGNGICHISLPIKDGVVDPRDVLVPEGIKAMLVSVMYVSNEIGTVQPIAEIAKRIRKLRKDNPKASFVFHTDASQAPAHFSLRIPSLGVDLMTLGATKLYCSKGVGILYKKRNVTVVPTMVGGGQERGLRPGTEPVELIHQFAHALMYAHEQREKETVRIAKFQHYFESEIEKFFPQVRITAKDSPRSSHITHIGIPNFDSELLVIELDARGIAVSSKSACKNEEGNESLIVEKLYGKNWGAIRVSFGRNTKKNELSKVVDALKAIFKKYH